VVAGRVSRKEEIGVCRSPERIKFGKPFVAETNYGSCVEVVIHDSVDAVIANVSQIENEAPGQRLLDSEVPRFHIRVFEVLINHEVVHCHSRVGNDSVRGNNRENRSGKTISKVAVCPLGSTAGPKLATAGLKALLARTGKL